MDETADDRRLSSDRQAYPFHCYFRFDTSARFSLAIGGSSWNEEDILRSLVMLTSIC